MEAIWITVVVVSGIVVAIVLPICAAIGAAQWARVRQVEADARLKQDMLARGLSVAEIERFSTPEGLRQAQIAADNKGREAQIAADAQMKQAQLAADLKRDMLAHGLSVEEIERLTLPGGPVVPAANQSRPDILVLANACESMVNKGDDKKEIAALLTAFLERPSGSQETARESRLPESPEARQARPEVLGLATAVESMICDGKNAKDVAELLSVFLGRHAGARETAQESNPSLPALAGTRTDRGRRSLQPVRARKKGQPREEV